MTSTDLAAKAKALEAEAAELRRQACDLRQQELRTVALEKRIVYAADSRCPCGAGLAYDPARTDETGVFKGPLSGYWDCSAILLGTADPAVTHTDKLPFAFYEIKSEGQASACGRTTRPAAKEGERC